ncbi:alpha/beta hydrolase [Hufsiella ginkgonis]|uniref:Esterase n=1 Tax=Hufsiella ginkgonis TaxID=2695274 RepID=A0A7K1XYF7_9SPHI|nr:esterase [Hufsiella ginkgonis]MXV16010.1 esterase [Hufsiella ginkgonis]
MKKKILLAAAMIWLTSCGKEPSLGSASLDSGFYMDPSLTDPGNYLLSSKKPNPTIPEMQKPVIIAIHGFGATTFEWDELRTWMGARTDFYLSQVLLGGHGRDFHTFKSASWEDWRAPIMTEYEKLASLGYNNISFAGSSAGCTLLLEMLADGYFNDRLKPKHIFMVDPFVIPSDKSLSIVGLLGPMVGYTTVDNTSGEERYYYNFRPVETLKELNEISGLVRKKLEQGFRLPEACTLKVFKSDKDEVADPVSALLIYKGVKTRGGEPIQVTMISSKLHVFTRLDERKNSPTAQDRANQLAAFSEMAMVVTQ